MSNPITFNQTYVALVNSLISDLTQLRAMNEQIAGDSAILQKYFDPPAGGTGQLGPRTDITTYDMAVAKDTVQKFLDLFAALSGGSGTPPNSAYLYKICMP